ncbi:MAG: hypothetical protein AB1635_09625 [Acidobacteriota bacterium]
MNQLPNHDLDQWTRAWHADEAPVTPPDAIRGHVRRRSRRLRVWLAGEAAVGLGALAVLARLIVVETDPAERAAFALLGLVVLGATLFAWHNWRDVLAPSADTTAHYLELAVERARRARRAVAAGWWILGAEVAVFVPWIGYRLYGGVESATAESQAFAWGLLAALCAAAMVALVAAGRWARRDEATIAALRGEISSSAADAQEAGGLNRPARN